MKTDLLDYHLPAELIAQQPCPDRSGSRLLVMDRKAATLEDRVFTDIGSYLRKGDCLVVNDTSVVPARFAARRSTGGSIEGLFLEELAPARWLVMLRNASRVRHGERIELLDASGSFFCHAIANPCPEPGEWILELHSESDWLSILGKIGSTPLPPYIRSSDGRAKEDIERYQTVYAASPGAIAAPTAGLHFTASLMDNLAASGIAMARITLHVGAGTFKPVSVDDLSLHKMHSERYSIDPANADVINRTRASGGRIFAVGTTTVRTLESAAVAGTVRPGNGSTDIFIRPGHDFAMIDAMITNFHLPRSTLIALVAAFAGLDETLAAYRHAVEMKYRFYSYGDAMLII